MWLEILFNAPQSGSTTLSGNNVYINWVNNLGHSFLKSCEIEIGGQKIDKLYSQWLDIWNELTDEDKKFHLGLGKNSSKDTYLESNGIAGSAGDEDISTHLSHLERRTYVHLPFWFSKNVGSALPLIALQYHEVKLKLNTRPLASLINTNGTFTSGNFTYSSPNVQLWIDYIYLDTDERRRFAQVSHEYLIEQLQVISKSVGTDDAKFKMDLDLNHPVKELIWVNQKDVNSIEDTTLSASIDAAGSEASKNDYFNYSSNLA